MALGEFISQNLEWTVTSIVTVITVIVSIRFSLSGMKKDISEIKTTDAEQSREINELKVTVARHEERLETLGEMKTQVSDIWKHIMRSKI